MIPACLVAAALTVQSPIDVWCVDSMQSVLRNAMRPDGAATTLDMRGARGQRVTAQIVLRAAEPGARVTGLRCSAPACGETRLNRTDFRWAFVEYIHVEKNSTATPPEELLATAPVDIPDAFSEERAVSLEPGRNQLLWVQLQIPQRAPAGIYMGSIAVQTSAGALTVPLKLTVYDFAFPKTPRLLVTIWLDNGALARHQKVVEFGEPYWQLVQRTAKLMRAHHQNTILTSWGMVHATREKDGGLRFDYGTLDRWIETFLRAGFERIEISHMGAREHNEWEDKVFVASELTCKNLATGKSENLPMEQWLPELESHLRARGWLERSMLHVADEPIPVNVDSWRKLSERVRAAAPHLRRIDAIHVPDLRGDIEVWVPELDYLSKWFTGFQDAQRTGAELWYYTAWVPQGHFPNRLLDYPLIKPRMLHWFNYLSGTTGYLHWGFNFWDVPFYQFAPGDNYIVYPGKSEPRSGLRYEAMREGIEDHEYLCLLEDAARAAAKRLKVAAFDPRVWTCRYLHRTARGFTDYTRQPADLLATRDAVARMIVALREPCAALATARRDGDAITVAGQTRPGAEVTCGTATAQADAGGRFMLHAAGAGAWVTLRVRHGADEAYLPLPVE